MMRSVVLGVFALFAVSAAAELRPAWQSLAGQHATCSGPAHKAFNIEMVEVTLDLGQGLKTSAWTFNGTSLTRVPLWVEVVR